jgi:hypothetical protein
MNLLEHYIVEIHKTKESDSNPDMIEVDVTYNCWGNRRRVKHITSKQQWQKDVERGYFIA